MVLRRAVWACYPFLWQVKEPQIMLQPQKLHKPQKPHKLLAIPFLSGLF